MRISRTFCVFSVAVALLLVGEAYAGVYIFTTHFDNAEMVTHPPGYDGTQEELVVSVCIDPESEARDELVIPLENVIRSWNGLEATTGNRSLPADNNVPSDHVDVESVLLHEIGHCIGLGHPNLDNMSGVEPNERRFTNSKEGANESWDLDSGSDGVQGSSQDERGDDVNLHWFAKAHNDPFVVEDVVDLSTYSVHLSDLPDGHGFAANANTGVGQLLGKPDTESVMLQGISPGTATRELAADDVAMIRLASTGLDGTQDTDADYEVVLEFVGEDDSCDISVEMGEYAFAYCSASGAPIEGSDHFAITQATIHLGPQSTFNWFFNDESNEESDDNDCDPDAIFCDNFED